MTNEMYYDNFLKKRYDPNKKPAAQEILFTIQNKTIGTIENYIVISGLPKTGKSTFLSAIIGSAMLPDYQDNFTMKLQPIRARPKICYIDTESSQFDFYRQIDRIKLFGLVSNLPDKIQCFNTREDQPGVIRMYTEQYLINNPDCSVLIIDGLLDLCINYNDEVETRKLTNWFKKITKIYNILLIGILHTGKGNGESLGHLGSNVDRWSQSVLTINKDKGTKQFIMTSKFCRSTDEIDPICLMNFEGQWRHMPYIDPIPLPIPKRK